MTHDHVRRIQNDDLPLDPLGDAAILLSNSGAPSDRELILRAVEKAPDSPGIWLSIANAANIDAARATLASNTYQNTQLNLLVRVAASAIELVDPKAAEFALSQIESFFARCRYADFAHTIATVLQSKDGKEPEVSDFAYDGKHSQIMRTLMVLKGTSVPSLVLAQIGSPQPYIRTTCGAIAALRWPDQFLQTGQGLFEDSQYAGLLAAIASKYPHRTALVQGRTTPALFMAAKEQIDRTGAVAFGGGLLQAFWKQ